MKTFKNLLLASTLIGILPTHPAQAMDISSIDEISGKHYIHYNSLPEVEDADSALQSHPLFQTFLKKAEKVVVRYEQEASIGLRLVHKHFLLKENKVMVENYELFEETPSLVTSAHSLEQARKKGAVPSSWLFTGKTAIQFFETSTDSAAKEGVKFLANEPEFIDEIKNLLGEHELSSLLALSIIKRESLSTDKEDEHYVETNFGGVEKSVVQIWKVKDTTDFYTRTSWSFKGPRQHSCFRATWCPTPHPLLGHLHKWRHEKRPGKTSCSIKVCTLL